jgi:hypothetical protein
MAWTKTKKTIAVVAGALLAVGLAMITVEEIQAHRVYPGLAGVWEGTLFKERVALNIVRTNGLYAATFDYVDLGLDVPASHFKPGKSAISFRYAGTTDTFTAKIAAGMTQMSANWRYGDTRYPFTLQRMAQPDLPEPLAEADYTPRAGSDFQGFWRGSIQTGAQHIRADLKIAEPSAGKLRAEMDRLDWGAQHIPASSVTREGGTLKISFSLFGDFVGQLDANGAQLTGSWTNANKLSTASFNRVDPQAESAAENFIPANPMELQGHWQGILKLPDGQLHFVFHIGRLADGSYAATMDDPDQGTEHMMATSLQYTAPRVSIMWGGIGGVFNGSLKNGELTGTWRQGGKVHRLTLTRDKT